MKSIQEFCTMRAQKESPQDAPLWYGDYSELKETFAFPLTT